MKYTTTVTQSFSGSPQGSESYANLTWTYRDGDWHGVCDGTTYSRDPDGVLTVTPFHADYEAASPPHWPLFDTKSPPGVGENVTVWMTRRCEITSDVWTFRGEDTATSTTSGRSVTAPTYRAASDDGDIPFIFATEWSRATGLVLEWSYARSYGTQAPFRNEGRLVDTDAPLG